MVNMAWGVGPGGVELAGTRGRAVLVNEGFGTHPFVPPERIVVVGGAGAREIAPEPAFGPSFELIAADFRDAVVEGRRPAADGAAGAAVLEAVVGAYAAAALQREVRLPLDPGDPVYARGAAGIADLELPAESPVRRRGLFGTGPAAGA
jgi:predicted dehydrogenase